jgi:cytochrome c
MKILIIVLAASFAALVMASSTPDAARGKEVFDKRCSGCHGLDKAKEGPPLRKVYGQPSAANPDFPYSVGVKKAHLIWDEATLDKWLQDPEKLIPDNDMATRVPDSADRANVIAYLKSLSGK